jgi:hypothetical protein
MDRRPLNNRRVGATSGADVTRFQAYGLELSSPVSDSKALPRVVERHVWLLFFTADRVYELRKPVVILSDTSPSDRKRALKRSRSWSSDVGADIRY